MANYNETNQGDLSNNSQTPTAIALSSGSNIVTGKTTKGANTAPNPQTNPPTVVADKDFFTFTVPDNSKVTDILLKAHTSVGDEDKSYFALTKGNKFDSIATDASYLVSKLIDAGQMGGISEINQDLLETGVGDGAGSIGDVGPGELGPGEYTVWYQETGADTAYEFDIQLESPPPAEASKLVLSGDNLIQIDLAADGVNALQVSIDTLAVSDVSEFQLFKTDSTGTVLGSGPEKAFSLLEPVPELSGFSPTFTVGDLSDSEYWQVALVRPEGTTIATPTLINDREVALDFGNNNTFSLKLDKFETGIDTGALQTDSNGDEYVDLSSENGTVTATFSVFREAAFNNTVGFYTAEANGDVVDPVTRLTISPGESGYKEAALAQRLNTTLSGVNGQETIVGNVTLEAGGFLGMFLAVDTGDPMSGDVFFSFTGANSDGSDHVKALGDNTFGFEDLVSLGDSDFNDMVVNLSFA